MSCIENSNDYYLNEGRTRVHGHCKRVTTSQMNRFLAKADFQKAYAPCVAAPVSTPRTKPQSPSRCSSGERGFQVKAWAILAVLALGVVLPFAALGYGGHDFGFHVSSWIEVRDAWLAHTVPGWSEGANFTLGDPHFCFYPPLSFALGGLLALLLPLRIVPAVYVWIAVFLSGLSMYYASKSFVAPRERLTAAALYMFNPYLLTTAIMRFAAAELLVQALLPLTVLALYHCLWLRKTRALLFLGGLLGIGWITNVPASIVMLYGFVAVAAAVAWDQRSTAPMLRLLFAEALAGALAAFYLAPVWIEQKWINRADLVRYEPKRGLLFMPQTTSSDVSVINYMCWIFALVGIAVIAASLRKRSSDVSPSPAARAWVYLAAVSFFFQLPLAIPLWNYLPELRASEFPFRFMPLLGVAVPLILLSQAARNLRLPAYALLALLATTPFLGAIRVHYLARSVAYLRRPDIDTLASQWARDGFPGIPENVPVGVSAPTAPVHLAPVSSYSNCTAALSSMKVGARTVATNSSAPCHLRLAVFFYPWWEATDESGSPLPLARDSDGLIAISVPPGSHTVHVLFRPHSRTRTWSAMVSLTTLLLVVCSLALFPRKDDPESAIR